MKILANLRETSGALPFPWTHHPDNIGSLTEKPDG